jgi:hypothetical protein
VSETESSVKAYFSESATISAYKEGAPGNGKLFPLGSKMVKIEWIKKKNSVSPYLTAYPKR